VHTRNGGWAIWDKKYTVVLADGTEMLRRRRIVRCPWFGIFAHEILSPDTGPDPHDHPWWFASMVLRGWYIETIWTNFTKDRSGFYRLRSRRRWSCHRILVDWAHQIDKVAPGTRTLVFVGKHERDWGFWTHNGWVRHDLYHAGAPREEAEWHHTFPPLLDPFDQ
jgi:hypothetical protein